MCSDFKIILDAFLSLTGVPFGVSISFVPFAFCFLLINSRIAVRFANMDVNVFVL